MSEPPTDRSKGQAKTETLNCIAASIFARCGVDFAGAVRAGGWSNATWLAGGLALRLSTRRGNDKIRNEARLASLLPAEVGYPPLVETGECDGYEWSLSKAIAGRNLGQAWPDLGWAERTAALRQMWQKARAVHSVDLAAAAGLVRQRSWFNATDAEAAKADLSRLVLQGCLTARQVEALGEALTHFWNVLPAAACVVNHGDLTLDNAIWHAGHVVALLDFEYAVRAPVELDLNALAAIAFAPPDRNDPLPDPDSAGRELMRQAVAELANPVIAHPGASSCSRGMRSCWRCGG